MDAAEAQLLLHHAGAPSRHHLLMSRAFVPQWGHRRACCPELLLPLPYQQVEADYAIFVADALNRVFRVDVVLELNNLLRRLRQVGDVGQRDVVGDLLLNGESRTGIIVSPSYRGIDANGADAKQFRSAAGHLLVAQAAPPPTAPAL